MRARLLMSGMALALFGVAAGSVGFAVGDVLTRPFAIAATSKGETEDLSWSWRLNAGQTITVRGLNGGISATRSGDGAVHVGARKSARHSDPASVHIDVSQDRDGVVVCAVYPGQSGCERGDHPHGDTHNNDVVVEFEVEVPAGVQLQATTVNGDVSATDLDGPVEARTVNGSAIVATRSWATAGTVNGSVRARIGQRQWDHDLSFATVNGSVTVEMPPGTGCEVEASTLNGEVSSDFPVTVSGRLGRHHLNGTLGGGGGALHASTVNGSIRFIAMR